MAQIKRIYTPITKLQCMTTNYAYVDGKLSYLKMKGVEVESIEDVQKSSSGVVDEDYSLLAGKSGHAEHGQIELVLQIEDDSAGANTNPAKGSVLLGASDVALLLSGETEEVPVGLIVGGTFGAESLQVIAALAQTGSFLKINGMYIDVDDNKHFAAKMIERRFKHDGSSAGDTNHLYPKAKASDEQTTIRTVENMNVFLDGSSFIDIPLFKGVEVSITLDTTYVK